MDTLKAKRKKIIILGSLIGGGLSAAIFFYLDYMFADLQHGTWRDAIAKDLNTLFSASVGTESIAVIVVYVLVLAILVAFGAFMGIVFCLFLERFFMFLKS
jgi:hypothetical protein